MVLEADAGTILVIAGDAVVAMIIATPAKTEEWDLRQTPMVTLATTAKAAQMGRMAWTSTSAVETPAAMVAMATAAKTAKWARKPTPGPFWKPRETLMALVKLLPKTLDGNERSHIGERVPGEVESD